MTNEILAEKANDIMKEAIKIAGELLHEKPLVAQIVLKQLLKCDPEHLEGLQLLGLCKHRLGENAEAVEVIQTALELNPESADNWNNLGLAYAGLGEHKRAIDSIVKAIELNPEQYLFKNNLALQYRIIGDHQKAIELLKEAIGYQEQPQLWLNLGGIYGEMKMIDEAIDCFKKAISLNPKYAAAYVDLAFGYHLKGDWKKGFSFYEWRFYYYPQMTYYLNSYDMSKFLHDENDLKDKTILIYGEQGLGDIIQFARFCPKLKDHGARVIVHCPANLEALIKRVPGVDDTTTRDIVNKKGPELPEYDYQISMMSLPNVLQIDRIDGKAYIKAASDSFKQHMEEKYPNEFKVGVVWAGSPAHPHDKKRSIPLKNFKNLQNIPGVRLFSLQLDLRKRQYGVTFRQVDANSKNDPLLDKFHKEDGIVDYQEGCDDMKLVDLTKMIKTFDDTSAILNGLDLIICCDTAVGHLAGAMGIPVWMMIPYNPDWRWGLSGDTTDWYDSMRLFRQEKRDDWSAPFKKAEEKLYEIVLQNQRQKL